MRYSIPVQYLDIPASFAISVLIVIFLLSMPSHLENEAFADGFSERTFTASFDERDAKLLVKVNPPILTSQNQQDAFMLFRLYDSGTNQTIKFTTLHITITKDGKELVSDFFQSAEGLLRLKIQPDSKANDVTIYGNKEGFLDAWIADPQGTVNLKGPILVEGGLYRLQTEVIGIDNPKNIFPVDNITTFDAYLSVGDFFEEPVQDLDGQTSNITIVSYYDKVSDFDFDAEKSLISWSMPFNYDVSRIEAEPDLFIHEEVRLPITLKGFGDSQLFSGSVNGIALPCTSIYLDPYSSNFTLTIHYLIDKDRAVKLANEYVAKNKGVGEIGFMNFALSASDECQHETSTRITTDNGAIAVALGWNPDQLREHTDENLTLVFMDSNSLSPLRTDVSYNFTLLSKGGTQILQKNLTAMNGTDTLSIRLPEDGVYPFYINVNGLATEPGDGIPLMDVSRNSRAAGYVVVPEFGAAAAIALTGFLIASIVIRMRIYPQ